MDHTFRTYWKRWGTLTVSGWLLVATFIGLVTMFSEWQMSGSLMVVDSLVFEWLCIIPWILITPVISKLANTYPLHERFSWKGLGMHLIGFFLAVTLHNLGQSGVVFWYYDYPATWEYIRRDWVGFLDMRLMLYGTTLAIFWAAHSFKREQEARLKKAQLVAELEKAKTDDAHNLMQPQLVIRSLQSIRDTLISGNLQEAERQLTKLSDVLRALLRRYRDKERLPSTQPINEHELLLNKYFELLRTQYKCAIQLPTDISVLEQSNKAQGDRILTQILNSTEQLLDEASKRYEAKISKISLHLNTTQAHQLEICVYSTRAFKKAISFEVKQVPA